MAAYAADTANTIPNCLDDSNTVYNGLTCTDDNGLDESNCLAYAVA
jgi:hypothetical protein